MTTASRISLTHCLTLGFLFAAQLAAASEKPKPEDLTITAPEQGGPDFALQGEYQGNIGDETWGAQVVALGDGKLDLVLYKGGLPGDGWKSGDPRVKGSGKRDGQAATFSTRDYQAIAEDGALTVFAADDPDAKLGKLRRVERKSPTLGKQPPEGAIVLFDGTSAEQFKGGQIVMGKLLATNCESKGKFGDHRLHIEFRTPFKPFARGQARGNSGVYIHNRYECQVLDSFGLEGRNNECGGIYSIAEPLVNMCFPPLSWQTYDIDFTAARYEGENKVKNARVTIRHNGVVIHDDLELEKGTPGKNAEGPDPDGIYLQGHGNPVVFRNIWVVNQ